MKEFRRSQSHPWKQYKIRWESLKTKLFSAKVVPPQITSKRYLRFSRITKVLIDGPGVPKNHIWKQRFIEHYEIQFFLKRWFHPEFTCEKTVLLRKTRQKISWPYKPRLKTCKPLLHDTKSYVLYTLSFGKFTSKKMILQLPIQLSMWCTSS